jgi:hypothetical protein
MKDYSKEIVEKFYTKDRIVRITLNDNSILEGILVGFFHGDVEAGETFITKWHFISEQNIKEYHLGSSVEMKNELNKVIEQKDIKYIEFKEKK